ncbi:MAG: extracellular solute-binding protein [Lachnospiraceae bacterium]|nr:extracellular solute-binding protein [Lachnospiraceae bacterium]
MKKKLIAALLTASMTAALLAGCGNGAAEEGAEDPAPATDESGDDGEEEGGGDADTDTDSDADGEEDLAEITVSFWSLAGVPDEENKAMVEDAINEITEAEINTTVHLNIMDVGSYIPNGAMANGVANGEDFDLVVTAAALSGHYNVMMSNGMLEPITDLLNEYAPELMATIPEGYLDATSKDGEVYAVPSYSNKVKNMFWIARNSALDAANIDINTIKTIDDLDAALHAIKETSPDLIPLSGASFTMNLTYPGFAFGSGNRGWDPLGESTAVAAAVYCDDETMTAVSRYETDEFKKDIEYLKKWYDDGLLDKDTATDSATGSAIMDKDNAASEIYVGQADIASTRAAASGSSYVQLTDSYLSTGSMQQFTWAIPVSCDEPEAAAKFMNLVFTNADIVNLLNYGIEGTHYVKKDDGTVAFPEGVTAENAGYYMGGLTAILGNGFLSYPWEGADPNSAEIGKKEMENAKYSPLMGFNLDTAALGDIYTALCPIANQEYGPALFCGSAPDGYYEEFIQKMKDAGLDEYLKQVNEQIQAWKAQQ